VPVSVALAILDVHLHGRHTFSRLLAAYRDAVGQVGWTATMVAFAIWLWWHIRYFKREVLT